MKIQRQFNAKKALSLYLKWVNVLYNFIFLKKLKTPQNLMNNNILYLKTHLNALFFVFDEFYKEICLQLNCASSIMQ